MKRPRNDLSSNKEKKKKKLNHSDKQQSTSTMNTIKESSKKFPAFKSNIVTQAPDPLFAGIAMKIMGNNRSSPFAAKALAPVKASKASSNATKGKVTDTSHSAKQQMTNNVPLASKTQEIESSDSNSSSDSSSGVGSLSSAEKEIMSYIVDRKDAGPTSSAKSISIVPNNPTSPDTSTDDGEPISFVSKPSTTAAETSFKENWQKKTKSITTYDVSSTSSLEDSDSGSSTVKNKTSQEKVKAPGPQPKLQSSACYNGSSSLKLKELARKVSPETIVKQTDMSNGFDSSLKEMSSEPSRKRAVSDQSRERPGKQVKSKALLSSDSSSNSSSDDDSPSSELKTRNKTTKKITEKPNQQTMKAISSIPPSKKIATQPSEGVRTQVTLKRKRKEASMNPKEDSSSDSSSSSDCENPDPSALPKKVPLKAKGAVNSKAMSGVDNSSDSSSSSSSSSSSDSKTLTPKTLPKKTVVKAKETIKLKRESSESDGSSSSSDSDLEGFGSLVKKLPPSAQPPKLAPNVTKKSTVDKFSAASSASRGQGSGSKSASETKKKTKRCISKATVSDDSCDSSLLSESDSDNEPVSFVPPSRLGKVKEASSYRAAPERSVEPTEKLLPNSTDSQNYAPQKSSARGCSSLGGAEFRKQPPMCVRKMNIIDMELSFHDLRGKPIEIENACFIGFMDNEDEPAEERTRNGIRYRIKAVLSDGTRHSEDLFLRVVDGRDGKLIRYEGSELNEDLQRVLLTHSVTCARCRLKQTCGTRAKAPECSVSHDGKAVTFHVRCNTTCAVNHGGRIGKQNNRTFKFVFSSLPDITEDSTLASSVQVNVHHNTKMKRLLNEGFNPFTREWGEPLPVV